MVLWIFGFGYVAYSSGWNTYNGGGSLLLWVIIALLGWQCYGPIVKS